MMEKQYAKEVQVRALRAVEELSSILLLDRGRCSPEEYELIKRGVGQTIGRIQMEIFEVLYTEHPEIDHLA